MQSNQGNVNGKRLGTRARYLNEVSIARRDWEPGSSECVGGLVSGAGGRGIFLNDISVGRHNGAMEQSNEKAFR